MEKRCPACTGENSDTAHFCNQCGQPLPETSPASQDSHCLTGWLVPVLQPWVSIRLQGREVTLGRNNKSAVDLSQHVGPQLEKALSTVSRVHARLLSQETGTVYLIDENSRNKTAINGVELIPGEKTELPDSACVKLGKLEMRFKKF